jgi:gluconolactonase
MRAAALRCAGLVALWAAWPAGATPQDVLDDVLPNAVVDLRTHEGVKLVRGVWRYADAAVVAVPFRGPGPDLRASGAPNRTWDVVPQAGAADFDDSSWAVIEAPALEARRGNGKLSFNWYRIRVTLPERVGRLPTAGMTVAFEIVVDDAAEIWVDGKLPLVLGQSGGALVKGFNAPNRVVLTRDARPGERFQIAVMGVNGPLSKPPANFIWVRSAVLSFYEAARARVGREVPGTVRRHDAALDEIVPAGARFEKVAGGFVFTEGPVWTREGHLLFSSPNTNVVYRWSPEGVVQPFRVQAGYSGIDIGEYHQPGSNGLTLDREGRLTVCEHGNRRVVRVEKRGAVTVLADRYEGKRLNSPNDLVYRSDGSLYFTDPPFGLPKVFDDRRKELPFSGVFRVATDGKVQLLTTELSGPNGIAFSPDEKYLYVGNWDIQKKVVMRYPVQADGALGPGEVFHDMTAAPGEDAIDGLKVDARGHVYVAGPGGLWILSPKGKHLGTLVFPESPHNLAWGDADARTLYVTALTSVYRIRLNVPGVRP